MGETLGRGKGTLGWMSWRILSSQFTPELSRMAEEAHYPIPEERSLFCSYKVLT